MRTLSVLLLGGLVALSWALAWHFMVVTPEPKGPKGEVLGLGDRSAILFGTSTVALVLISLVIGGVAFFGWQTIKDSIRRDVESSTRNRLEQMEIELRGRSSALLGYTIGETSVDADYLHATNPERLREAKTLCQQGYNRLRKVGGAGEVMALNNLLMYSSILGDTSRRGYYLKRARQLRKAGEDLDKPHLLLTYCRIVLYFGLDPAEKDEACAIVQAVRAKEGLQEKERREADHLASLCMKPSASGPPGKPA